MQSMIRKSKFGGGATCTLASWLEKDVKKMYNSNERNYTMGKRLGFTLAEVLITLAIIGVVAVLTLPNLIHNFQIKALKTQFKETQSIITQAVGLMKASENLPSLYDYYIAYDTEKGYYRSKEFKNNFKNYIKVQNSLDKAILPDYYTYDGSQKFESSNRTEYVVSYPDLVLANGAYLHLGPSASLDGRYLLFLVDINGAKGPNRYGHDCFCFVIKNSNDIVDGRKMTKLYTEEELENITHQGMRGIPCSIKSKQSSNGIGCAWYAINDICPDDETKGYWECLPK